MASHGGANGTTQGWNGNAGWAEDSVGAASANTTFSVINQFKFEQAKSIRSSTIILASFNTVTAFATAAGILFDCYLAAKKARAKEDPKWNQTRITVWNSIQETELYPLILSLGIMLQGIIFAVSQSQGLDSLFEAGCTLISSFMLPAIFIVPFLQLVLGLEVTIRGVRNTPFPPRSKWNITICLVIVGFFLLATILVAILIPAPDFCFSTFLWFVADWAEGAFAVFLAIATTLAICTIIIPLRLSRYSMIEDLQRISASRMVYYLIAAVISNALLVPYFLTLTFGSPSYDEGDSGMTLDMIATVVANVSGLITGGLYLFLRRSTISTIQPRDRFPEKDRQRLKSKIRLGSPSKMDFNDHMSQPVTGPQSFDGFSFNVDGRNSLEEIERIEKPEGEFWPISRASSQYNANEPNTFELADNVGQASTSLQRPSAAYSIFPSMESFNKGPVPTMPAASNQFEREDDFYPRDSLAMLKPPPLITPGRHQRNSSVGTSATVQIGLRFSDVNNMPKRKGSEDSGVSNLYGLPPPPPLLPPPPPSARGPTPLYPSPLATVSRTAAVKTPPPVAAQQTKQRRTSSVYSDYMKNLPRIPTNNLQQQPQQQQQQGSSDHNNDNKKEGSEITLSPTVYDPSSPSRSTVAATRTKNPSPKGVGFQIPQRAPTQSSDRNGGDRSSGKLSSASASASQQRTRSSGLTKIDDDDWI